VREAIDLDRKALAEIQMVGLCKPLNRTELSPGAGPGRIR
jgi:hypothetical protein